MCKTELEMCLLFVCLLLLSLFALTDGGVSEVFSLLSLVRPPGQWYFPCVPPAWRTSKVMHCGQKVKTNTEFHTIEPRHGVKMPPVRLRPWAQAGGRLPTQRRARRAGGKGIPASGAVSAPETGPDTLSTSASAREFAILASGHQAAMRSLSFLQEKNVCSLAFSVIP